MLWPQQACPIQFNMYNSIQIYKIYKVKNIRFFELLRSWTNGSTSSHEVDDIRKIQKKFFLTFSTINA